MKLKALLALILVTSQSSGAVDLKEIKFKSRDLDKVRSEINQKKEENERIRKEAENIRGDLQKGQMKIRDVEQSLLYTKKKTVEMEMQVASTTNARDRYLADAKNQKENLRSNLQQFYVASLLRNPSSNLQVFSRQIVVNQLGQLREVKSKSQLESERLSALIDSQQVVRKELSKQEEILNNARSNIRDRERLLEKKKTRQEILATEVKELQSTANELASMIDILRSKVKEEAQAEKKARLEKQISGKSPIAMRSLPWPMEGEIKQKFGRQKHPTLGTSFVSNGIIISQATNSDVLAVSEGKVLFSGQFMSYGPMVVVEHPGDWYSVYGQMSRWNVNKGQEVKKGEKVGSSRMVPGEGKEAYFELRFYGKPVDPLPWLQSQ